MIAFFAGIAYGLVAIPAQTQLQEDLPADVRGRVFGVLNMLVSVASFLPIIVVGPISDLVGTTSVIFAVAIGVLFAGLASVLTRGPLLASQTPPACADPHAVDPIAAALGADRPTWSRGRRDRAWRPDRSASTRRHAQRPRARRAVGPDGPGMTGQTAVRADP